MKKSLILILLMFILLLGACGKKAPEVIDPNPDDNTEEETPIEVPKFEVYTLYVNTKNNAPIVSKEEYVKGTVEVKEGEFKTGELSMEIRGRGNSTWGLFPKKPYRIKMKERYPLLGMRPLKNYVLLAEYSDKSLLRNYLAHKLSSYLNTHYVLETRYVELYLNNEYQGVYLLTEQIRDDKEGLVVGNYLIELEQELSRCEAEGPEDVMWFEEEGAKFVVKSPDMEKLTPDEVKTHITYLHTFIRDLNFSFNTEMYDYYIDLDNFIDYFILHEIFKTVDIGYSSVYSVIKDNKLYMGPHWDFDISLGNGDYFNSGPELYRNRYNPWFNKIIDNPNFKEKYLARLSDVLYNIMPKLLEDLDFAYNGLKVYAERNFLKWNILDKYVWGNPEAMYQSNKYEDQYLYLKNHLELRIQWLKHEIVTNGYYDYLPE